MKRNTKANNVRQWRRRIVRGRVPEVPLRRVTRARRMATVIEPERRLNFTPLSNRRGLRSPTNLENTIRVGAIRPTNATMLDAMKKGKIPKSVRALLLLAMSNPYTAQTQAAMEAANYLQKELNKHKSKKSKSK